MDDSVEDLAKGLAKEFYSLVTRVSVLESRLSERDRALVMQATEYGRRLDELNHAHAQQVQRNSDFIGREVWEAHRNGIDVRFMNLEKILHEASARIALAESKVDARDSTTMLQVQDNEHQIVEMKQLYQQVLARTAEYIGRVNWEAHKTAIDNRFKATDDRLNEFDNWRSRIIGISIGISVGAGLAGGIISALLTKLFK